jgi:pyridoxal phosphate enzyme (YggS family)
VQGRIAAACRRAGREPAAVRLVAVSKTVAADRVRALVAAGQAHLGENRVQEALAKMPAVGPGAVWHLVGHLQRNKARLAVGRFELIHSLDGVPLAEELDRRARAAGLRQAVLVQANLSREASKFGAEEGDLASLLARVAGLPGLDLRGLMILPPPPERPEDSRPWFRRLREWRDRAVERLQLPLPELSMGMSDDFEVAVEEGATLVRVGRVLFGERPVE